MAKRDSNGKFISTKADSLQSIKILNQEATTMETINATIHDDSEILDSEKPMEIPHYLDMRTPDPEKLERLNLLDAAIQATATVETVLPDIAEMEDYNPSNDAELLEESNSLLQECNMNSSWFNEMRPTIKEAIALARSGKLNMKVPYQRADNAGKWKTPEHQTKLFKSIILGRPIELFTWRDMGNGTYECINSKQRITTILKVVNDDLAFTELPPGLDIYEGMTFSMLPDEMRNQFYNYKLQVNVIKEDDDDAIQDYYEDINTGTVPMSAADVRKGKAEPIYKSYSACIGHKLWKQTIKTEKEDLKIFGDIKESWRNDILVKLCCDLFGDCNHASTPLIDWFIKFEHKTHHIKTALSHVEKFAEIMRFMVTMDKPLPVLRKIRGKNNVSAILAAIDEKTDAHEAAINIHGFFTSDKTSKLVLEYAKHSGGGTADAANVQERIRIMKNVISGR